MKFDWKAANSLISHNSFVCKCGGTLSRVGLLFYRQAGLFNISHALPHSNRQQLKRRAHRCCCVCAMIDLQTRPNLTNTDSSQRVPLHALEMLTQSVPPLTRDYVHAYAAISVNINNNFTNIFAVQSYCYLSFTGLFSGCSAAPMFI